MEINVGRVTGDTVSDYSTCAWRLTQPIMRVAKSRIQPVQTVNSANAWQAVRECRPSSHPRFNVIQIDLGEQASQRLFEHKGASVIRRSLNAREFRGAGNPDPCRHLTGDAHMFHVHDGIVDLDAGIPAHKVIATFGFERQMQAKRL